MAKDKTIQNLPSGRVAKFDHITPRFTLAQKNLKHSTCLLTTKFVHESNGETRMWAYCHGTVVLHARLISSVDRTRVVRHYVTGRCRVITF